MPFEISSVQHDIERARELLSADNRDNLINDSKKELYVLIQTQIRNLTIQEEKSGDELLGLTTADDEEVEALLISELEQTCQQLENTIAFYQDHIQQRTTEKDDIMQLNSDLNNIYKEYEKHTDENTRQLESMRSTDNPVYETEVESYKKDYSQLQKANKILINEIKDLLCLCYGNRKSSINPDELLSKEILTILEDCIKKELSKNSADRYITLTPKVASSESVQLLYSANLLQKDKSDSCRVRLIDYTE